MSADLLIRAATLDDAAELAKLHVAIWRVAYHGIVPDDYLAKLDVNRMTKGWRERMNTAGREDFVAIAEGEIVGFVTIGPNRDGEAENVGELWAIYVGESRWRGGAGSVMYRHAIQRLRQRGFQSVIANTRARRFYEKQGLMHDGVTKSVDFGGRMLDELRYGGQI
jgi:GNAT superfamily N-acetyltransferase